MAINGIALAAAAAGTLLLFSAIENKSVLSSVKAVIQGKSPTTASANTATLPTPPLTPETTGELAAPGVDAPSIPDSETYNATQLASLWILAGGSQATSVNAACHAMQESSGNPLALSANPDGGTNVGLWQLDTPGGKGAGYTVSQLQNPLTNARVAVTASSGGRDWSAWATPGC